MTRQHSIELEEASAKVVANAKKARAKREKLKAKKAKVKARAKSQLDEEATMEEEAHISCYPQNDGKVTLKPGTLSGIIPLTEQQVMTRRQFRVLVGRGYHLASRVIENVSNVPAGHCRVQFEDDQRIEDIPFAPVCVISTPGLIGSGHTFPRFIAAGADSFVTQQHVNSYLNASSSTSAPESSVAPPFAIDLSGASTIPTFNTKKQTPKTNKANRAKKARAKKARASKKSSTTTSQTLDQEMTTERE